MKLPAITETLYVAMTRRQGFEGWGFSDGYDNIQDAVDAALYLNHDNDFRIVRFDPDGVIRDVTEDACLAVQDACLGEPPMLPTWFERDHARYLFNRDEVA